VKYQKWFPSSSIRVYHIRLKSGTILIRPGEETVSRMGKNKATSSLLRYGVALLAVLAATLIRLTLHPVFGSTGPFVFFIIAVIVAAWFGGRGPGLLATLLGAFTGAFFFLEPAYSFSVAKTADRGNLGLYVLISVVVSLFIGALRSAKQRAEMAVNQAEHEIQIRQQREQALRESEQRFRELANSMPQLVWTASSDGKVDYYNSRVSEYGGASTLPDGEQKWEPLLHPDDLELTRAAWQHAAAAEQPYSFEHRMQMADGSYRWHLSRALPVRGEAGGIMKWFGTATDIHALRETQEAYHESQEMLMLAMRSSRMGAWSRDIVTNEVQWNAELEEIFGLPPGGFAGTEGGFYDFVHTDDRAPLTEAVERAIADHTDYAIEFRFHHADGSLRWMEGRGRAVYTPDGQPLRLYGIGIDITERKQVEEKIIAGQNRLRTALEAGRMGSWDLDLRSGVLTTSDVCKAIYGRQPSDRFTYKEFIKSIHKNDLSHWRKIVETSVSRVSDFEVEYRNHWPDGSLHWVLVRGTCTADESGKAVVVAGVSVDVTERKVIEEERERMLEREQQARAAAEQANRLKDEFLATVSHELRTPLNAIMGWTVMLRSGKLDEKTAARALETIERNTRSQSKLIEDLLDVSRIISGKLRLDAQEIELVPIIHAAIDVIGPAAEAKEIDLQIKLDPSVGRISGDASRIQQIIWNLLSNAVKFTPPKGRVEIELKQKGGQVEILITDTGKGISPEFLPHVFDRFRQADNSTSRLYSGLGLGLAIVRHLVELHGGTVSAHSSGEGTGATFIVTLPALPSDAPNTAELAMYETAANKSLVHPPSLQGLRVLVVDDEIDGREMLKKVLLDCNAQVTTCGSAGEAFDLVQSYKPDVLVSDIGMPGEDGYMLIKRVRALEPEFGGQTPAIALTAYTRMEDRLRALAAGFQMHASKPIEPLDLIVAVASLTGRAETLETT
jgi:PAS domain S-box-containing protein